MLCLLDRLMSDRDRMHNRVAAPLFLNYLVSLLGFRSWSCTAEQADVSDRAGLSHEGRDGDESFAAGVPGACPGVGGLARTAHLPTIADGIGCSDEDDGIAVGVPCASQGVGGAIRTVQLLTASSGTG